MMQVVQPSLNPETENTLSVVSGQAPDCEAPSPLPVIRHCRSNQRMSRDDKTWGHHQTLHTLSCAAIVLHTYRIAGNFRGYKISRIVPNLVKTKFSRFLISRSITVMARAYAQL